MEITTYRNSDMWTFRVVVALLALGAVFAAAHFLGRYLHEDQAYAIAHGDKEPGAEGRHKAALELSRGWKDTKGYEEVRSELTAEEQSAARVTSHELDKYAPIGAAVGALIALFASSESGRIWARKQAAHRAQNR